MIFCCEFGTDKFLIRCFLLFCDDLGTVSFQPLSEDTLRNVSVLGRLDVSNWGPIFYTKSGERPLQGVVTGCSCRKFVKLRVRSLVASGRLTPWCPWETPTVARRDNLEKVIGETMRNLKIIGTDFEQMLSY